MNEKHFRRILRSALTMTLAAPFVTTAASSCGGDLEDPGNASSSGTTTTPTSSATGTDISNPPGIPDSGGGGNVDGSVVDDAATDTGGPNCGNAKLPKDDTCSRFVQMPCSVDQDASFIDQETCSKICPKEDAGGGPSPISYFCSIGRDESKQPYVSCNYCVIGRRPEGLVATDDHHRANGTMMGAFFADASRLEAASVDAFLQLREELALHDAPLDLLDRADRAMRDEIRHARVTRKLAHRFGAEDGEWIDAPRVDRPTRDRSLEAIAIENAIEGQVRETFGALVGLWQAEHASDPRIRGAMQTIAEDEVRHAALAWSVGSFAHDKLDDAARERVTTAMNEAIATLESEIAAEPHEDLVDRAGLPNATEAKRLLASLRTVLWS